MLIYCSFSAVLGDVKGDCKRSGLIARWRLILSFDFFASLVCADRKARAVWVDYRKYE